MTYQHIAGVKVSAKFSEDRKFRYRLEISLENPSRRTKTACVIMQNPSYADENVADKSVQFMEKVVFQKQLAEFEEVKRLIVVNQFAFIQTNDFEGLPDEIGSENNSAIKSALKESDIIILGWGVRNRFKERQTFIRELIYKMEGKQLFETKKHPARAGYDGFIIAV
jgi:hypothetical protein